MVPFLRVKLNPCIGSLVSPVTSPSLNADNSTAKFVVIGKCVYVSFWLNKNQKASDFNFFFLIGMGKN